MRVRTRSACVVLAWGILLILVAVGSSGSLRPAQANIRIASNPTAVTATGSSSYVTTAFAVTAPHAIRPWAQTEAKTTNTATYVVQPGDTLSGIAAALSVRGGWPALYAVNRSAVGPDPDLLRPGTQLTLPGRTTPDHYTVAAGDTLSGIAAALGTRGGWPALYAVNRRVIGADPNTIRPGTLLAIPRPTAATSRSPGSPRSSGSPEPPGSPGSASTPARHPSASASGAPHRASTPTRAPTSQQSSATATAPATPGATAPAATPTRLPATAPGQRHPGPVAATAPGQRHTRPVAATQTAGGLPRWLEIVLLAAGLLIGAAFLTEPTLAIARRSRTGHRTGLSTRIVLADYDRLVVTHNRTDDTVCVLRPPGADPQAILLAARLVLAQDRYEELAGHLGVPAHWPRE
jgi:LysM repeat protein